MAEYRTEDVPWAELVPGQIIEGKDGDLMMITGVGWQRPDDDFDKGAWRVDVQLGYVERTRLITPMTLDRHPTANVLIRVVVDEQAAVAAAGGTVIEP